MKKSLFFLSIVLLFSSCAKKKQQVANLNGANSSSSQRSGSTNFDDGVEEFVLEDDADANVFEDSGLKDVDALDLEDVTLDASDNNEVVQFDFDNTEIKPEEHAKLEHNEQHLKDQLKKNKKATVVVDGHSCKIARSESYNYMISQERANNVAEEYVASGIPEGKVKAIGHGDSMVITNAKGKAAQSPNRRAETKVIA